MAVDESLSYAPELVSIIRGEEDVVEEGASEEQAAEGETSEEQASEEPQEPKPVIDENGVVYLTRTTTKGG